MLWGGGRDRRDIWSPQRNKVYAQGSHLPGSRSIHGSQRCLFNPLPLLHLPPDLSSGLQTTPWPPIHHTAFMLPTFTLLTPLQECPSPSPTSETQVPFKAQLNCVTSSRRPSLIPIAAVPPPFPENAADVPPTELVLVSPLDHKLLEATGSFYFSP